MKPVEGHPGVEYKFEYRGDGTMFISAYKGEWRIKRALSKDIIEKIMKSSNAEGSVLLGNEVDKLAKELEEMHEN